jgi:hypothetical protein
MSSTKKITARITFLCKINKLTQPEKEYFVQYFITNKNKISFLGGLSITAIIIPVLHRSP